MKTSNFKLLFIVSLIFLSGFTSNSNAQSSCCQITIVNKVDCPFKFNFICNYNLVKCDSSGTTVNPPSVYYLIMPPKKCSGNSFNIDPGSVSYPTIQTVTFPVTMCPCTPLDFEIFGYNFTLTGNNFFDDYHTWQHLGVIGGCCGAGINVSWDPVNCIITLIPSCP